jgi:hypothetical protein
MNRTMILVEGTANLSIRDSPKRCDDALAEAAQQAKREEPDDEFHKIAAAIGNVVYELDRALISPTLQRHPDLLAEAERLKIR